MSLAAVARWLEQRDWAGDFSASQWLYPSVLAIHLTCIAIFGGMILVTNLRLLGFLRSQSLTDVVQKLRFWKRTGFVIMVTCGALLAGSEAEKYYVNPYFWIKMTLSALIGVHGMVFRNSVYRNTAELDGAQTMPSRAKLAAALSLILWIGVLCAGRMIGYYVGPRSLAAWVKLPYALWR